MKVLIRITLIWVFLLSILVSASGKEYGEPIIFQIIDEKYVEVNGEKVTIKKSWMEANKYIDPYKVNVYKVEGASDYPSQTDLIIRNMSIVAKTAGVEIEQAK